MFDPDPTIKMLALGMAISVLVDSSVVRLCLVRIVMSLLGERAWWIRWLDRILPTVDIEGSGTARPAHRPGEVPARTS